MDLCMASLWASQAARAADLTHWHAYKETGGGGSYRMLTKTSVNPKATEWKQKLKKCLKKVFIQYVWHHFVGVNAGELGFGG